MSGPQFTTAESETFDQTQVAGTRQYPSHECVSPTPIPPGSLGDVSNSGVHIIHSHYQSPDFTNSPSVRHQGCEQMNLHETITQSHGLPHQHQISGGASNHFQSMPSSTSFWTNSGWTNPSDLVLRPPLLTCHADQNNHDPFEPVAAQMQSSNRYSFVPRGGQAQNTIVNNTNHIPLVDQQALSSRPSSTPRLSHVTTPDSVFSTSPQNQASRHGSRVLANPQSTMASGQTAQATKKIASPSHAKARKDGDLHFRHGYDVTSSYDWLSHRAHGQEWVDDLDLPDAQSQQYAIFPNSHRFNSSFISPQRLTTNISATTVPTKALPPQDDAVRLQPTSATFAPQSAPNVFTMPSASSATMIGYLQNSYGPFMTEAGQDVHTKQPNVYFGGFDFNSPPLYPATHYPAVNASQSHQIIPNTLLTQNNAAASARNPRSRVRVTTRAADMDEKLVKWRAEGMTYRDIMKKGNWGLEESTLRGRYRTLTKNKEDRLRKPVWNNASLSALVAGVDRFAPSIMNGPRTTEGVNKVPWKKVAEWMHRDKGCYLYGNATVKKKYRELVGDQVMQASVNQWRHDHGELPF